ncbi:AI-2E family transporter [Aeromicrobium sp. NPDC092404]|uniref:AI-2E family transporter n=1 Tax=Aeromicrobium sp. NPDC092404 TaxID=3154976 RepID=UPI003429AE97
MRERYQVPIGVEIATQWAWRILVIAGAALLGVYFLRYFSEITVPLAVAVLGTALTVSIVDWLVAHRVPRLGATLIVVLGLLTGLFGMLALVGQQLATQASDLRSRVVEGISEVQDWARTGPLNLSDDQLQSGIDNVKDAIRSSDTSLLTRVSEVGSTLTHLLAGFFIALFCLFFFLYEGNRIWSWVVALFPRAAREKVDSSGHTAWASLTAFVRATVIVALVDAIGIAFGAWVLGVPLTLAIGVLVFLGAFIPIIGALLSGMVAVLVALVAQGPWTALFMLLVVIAIQQLESHVLQPFLMGRFVAVHPLAIIFAIAGGVVVAGVVGALIAVPLAACLNGVVRHLAAAATEFQDEPSEEDGGTALPGLA